MTDPVVLRVARPEDREPISAMVHDCVVAADAVAYDTDEGLQGYWDDPRGWVYVAEQGGVVVGTYVLKPNQPGHGGHVANAGYIVARAARGRGLAIQLGEHSLEMAREKGFTAMQFNLVVSSNEAAVRAWRRLGFQVIGRVPGGFLHLERGPIDTLIFYRTL